MAHQSMPSSTAWARRLVIGGLLSLGIIAPAFCQTPYETRLYRPPSSTLEPNYGLPSFGMPGSELPKQRTMATQRGTSSEPDFLTSLGARPSAGDDQDDLKTRPSVKATGETPDMTTPDSMDVEESRRQTQAAPE